MFKVLFELATDPLGLPVDWYWEWIILFTIDGIAYEIAWAKVRELYHSGLIFGSVMGSFFHWLIRLICFVIIWAVTYGIIWIGEFIIAHWKVVLGISVGLVAAILLVRISQLLIRMYGNKKGN